MLPLPASAADFVKGLPGSQPFRERSLRHVDLCLRQGGIWAQPVQGLGCQDFEEVATASSVCSRQQIAHEWWVRR